MRDKYILDSEHNIIPIPDGEDELVVWASWFEKSENRIVKREMVEGDWSVSTVFLGLDHKFARSGPPILFETMIFINAYAVDYVRRCSTWKQAERMHEQAVEFVRENRPMS